MKKLLLFVAAMAMTAPLPIQAQVKIKAVAESNRYDGTDGVHEKGDQMVSDYVGYINGKAMFIVENGIYSFNVDADAADAPTFNMMGQRVSPDTKGVLIRGGKKVIVR